MIGDYSTVDIASALETAGLHRGDVVFSHSNIGYFGRHSTAKTAFELCEAFAQGFQSVIGQEGTLVVPTFSYSFGSDKPEKVFDVARTPGVCGTFTEYLRKRQDSIRSADPMFSIVAIGAHAEYFTRNADPECFGENSFWRRFLDARGIFCNLNLDASSTFIHFVERRIGVPYRQNRVFSGAIVDGGLCREAMVTYFSRSLDDNAAVPSTQRFDEVAREANLVRTSSLGRGAIVTISAESTARLIRERIEIEPRFLTVSGAKVT